MRQNDSSPEWDSLLDAFIGYLAQGAVSGDSSYQVARTALAQMLASLHDTLPAPDSRAADAALRSLLEAGPSGYLVTGSNGTISHANRASGELLSLSPGTIVGHPLLELVAPQQRRAVQELLADLACGETCPVRSALDLVPASGSSVRVAVVACRASSGAVHWLLNDVSDGGTQRRALSETQRLVALGRLASNIAHEFNNLLTIINGETQLLLEGMDPSAALRGDVEEIRHAGLRAAELTAELLASARTHEIRVQAIDLNEALQGMARVLRRVLGEDVAVELDLTSDPLGVRADPAVLRQIVVNLALNARDAMPAGGTLTLATRREPLLPNAAAAPAGPQARLTVTDTGSGMSAEVQAHLFEPFFTTKAEGEGTGLGLSLVQEMVRDLGGSVEVRSTEGVGSAISILLPLAQENAQAGTAGTRAVDPSGGSETILLVEDDPHVRRLTVRMLARLGYEVLQAEDANAALRTWEAAKHVDLLLTDVVLPGASGVDLAGMLRRAHPQLSVLFTSGYPRDTLGRGGTFNSETHYLLAKPFTLQQVATMVRRALTAPRTVEEGTGASEYH